MKAATRLMEAGASLPGIAQRALDHRSTAAIRLWAAALGDIHIDGAVIWTSIALTERREAGYRGNGNAGLPNFLLSADSADVSVVFAEREDGSVDVSMRAEPGFDIAEVALAFDGGGHALAAGCRLPGPLEEAEESLLSALQASLNRQRRNYA
jgi:phosphoesterase RecJ-like protein